MQNPYYSATIIVVYGLLNQEALYNWWYSPLVNNQRNNVCQWRPTQVCRLSDCATYYTYLDTLTTLHWRHNERHGVSNHHPHDHLLNCLFRRRSKKTSKLSVTGRCSGNSPVTGEFPAQMASNAENVSILDDVIMIQWFISGTNLYLNITNWNDPHMFRRLTDYIIYVHLKKILWLKKLWSFKVYMFLFTPNTMKYDTPSVSKPVLLAAITFMFRDICQ